MNLKGIQVLFWVQNASATKVSLDITKMSLKYLSYLTGNMYSVIILGKVRLPYPMIPLLLLLLYMHKLHLLIRKV